MQRRAGERSGEVIQVVSTTACTPDGTRQIWRICGGVADFSSFVDQVGPDYVARYRRAYGGFEIGLVTGLRLKWLELDLDSLCRSVDDQALILERPLTGADSLDPLRLRA